MRIAATILALSIQACASQYACDTKTFVACLGNLTKTSKFQKKVKDCVRDTGICFESSSPSPPPPLPPPPSPPPSPPSNLTFRYQGLSLSGLEQTSACADTNYEKCLFYPGQQIKFSDDINIVRLPFQPVPGGHSNCTVGLFYDQDMNSPNDNVVSMFVNAIETIISSGRTVILDMHTYTYQLSSTLVGNGLDNYWKQTAHLLNSTLTNGLNDDKIILGLQNEPYNIDHFSENFKYVRSLRSEGFTNWIILGIVAGNAHFIPDNNASSAFKDWNPAPSRIYIEIHQYFDSASSGSYPKIESTFCDPSKNVWLTPVNDWVQLAIKHNVQILITEIGVPYTVLQTTRNNCYKALFDAIQKHDPSHNTILGFTIWVNNCVGTSPLWNQIQPDQFEGFYGMNRKFAPPSPPPAPSPYSPPPPPASPPPPAPELVYCCYYNPTKPHFFEGVNQKCPPDDRECATPPGKGNPGKGNPVPKDQCPGPDSQIESIKPQIGYYNDNGGYKYWCECLPDWPCDDG